MQDGPVGREARAVARAVPAALGAVEVDLAAEVRAERRDRAQRAVLGAVAGDLLAAVADDVALAGREVLERAAAALGQRGRRRSARRPARSRSAAWAPTARGFRRSGSKSRVGSVLAAVHEVGEHARGGGAVGHPPLGEARGHEHARLEGRQPADERQPVDASCCPAPTSGSRPSARPSARARRPPGGRSAARCRRPCPVLWPSPPTSSSSSSPTGTRADAAGRGVAADEHALRRRAGDPAGDRVASAAGARARTPASGPGTGSASRRSCARRARARRGCGPRRRPGRRACARRPRAAARRARAGTCARGTRPGGRSARRPRPDTAAACRSTSVAGRPASTAASASSSMSERLRRVGVRRAAPEVAVDVVALDALGDPGQRVLVRRAVDARRLVRRAWTAAASTSARAGRRPWPWCGRSRRGRSGWPRAGRRARRPRAAAARS